MRKYENHPEKDARRTGAHRVLVYRGGAGGAGVVGLAVGLRGHVPARAPHVRQQQLLLLGSGLALRAHIDARKLAPAEKNGAVMQLLLVCVLRRIPIEIEPAKETCTVATLPWPVVLLA